MSAEQPSWNIDELTPEARRAAEDAAAAVGMPVEAWLNQLIKYVSAMELSGEQSREAMEAAVETKMAEAMTVERPAAESEAEVEDTSSREPEPEPEPAEPGSATDEEEPSLITEGTAPVQDPVGAEAEDGGESFMGLVPVDTVEFPANVLRPDGAEIQAAVAATQKTGSLEPLVVRRRPGSRDVYEVVTGADRLEAARKLRRDEVPVIVRTMDDEEAERAALVDRIKRRRMPPVEEARVLGRLSKEADLDDDALAALVHRPVREVRDALDLLKLPDAVLRLVERGELTIAHARALTRAADPEALADEVVARRLDIYQTEQLVLTAGGRPRFPAAEAERPAPAARESDEDAMETELLMRHLSALLGLKVTIVERSDMGVVAIQYANRDQLNRLISRLNTVSGV